MLTAAAVLFALACAVRADGAAALGVQHRPVSAHVRILASYVTGPILAFTVSLLVLSVLLGAFQAFVFFILAGVAFSE